MRNRAILSICAAALLSGCGIQTALLKGQWQGKTYEQLVASQSTAKTFLGTSCYRCDGQPTRTYTSKDGNEVVVYFYWRNYDVPGSCDRYGCGDGYSYCAMREQHFELANGVVIDARELGNTYASPVKPLYNNACDGHVPYILDSERNPLDSKPFDQE